MISHSLIYCYEGTLGTLVSYFSIDAPVILCWLLKYWPASVLGVRQPRAAGPAAGPGAGPLQVCHGPDHSEQWVFISCTALNIICAPKCILLQTTCCSGWCPVTWWFVWTNSVGYTNILEVDWCMFQKSSAKSRCCWWWRVWAPGWSFLTLSTSFWPTL